jgi:uncharacterized membrane protein
MCCMMMHEMDHSGHAAQTVPQGASQSESLLDILQRRYALGEITHEQFKDMKRTLGVSDAPQVASASENAHH